MMGDNSQRQEQDRQAFPGETSPPTKLPGEWPLSPPPSLLARPPIHYRASLTSIKRMPMIREDESPLLTSLPRRRPRPASTGVFYQYGEDYITPWHLVGTSPSPTPRAPSRQGGVKEDWGPGEEQGRPLLVRDGAWDAKLGGWRRLRGSRYWSWL